ncbi:putative ribosomal RNA large subunit methyltransferase A [Myxococcus xanthus DK 1622]|uniref:Ribosomal RNA large subunit methyltransferase A n=1 Tax=Myxococcus xanthus (strain DK1622) TaxID=246197 RepID=Q1D2D0_MYXXD|nr:MULTISPECIES: methyltransferase domain-containing protein [Myxococcus]ABF86126.1 putative ribosomal RNA large subunit methyltransferase A [Myxococcus xanthus DK 1622]QZZ52702.1 23S rRNA (guanine(748)-N(1))-methyltransferase [Myxococcus xanthus]UYI12406.1 methyltransferase domain-containing protein [Myxococcus xanthus]UYI19774.1 methyltransferase domain-containing protein [Myxococcus xanthus]SDX53610.1 23S rRNA m(1)G-748 methyltransferase [Myxococcus xanthus]
MSAPASPRFPPPLLPLLCCPICQSPLRQEATALRCVARHGFDVARQGYVNLLPGHRAPGNADTQSMVAARETFLARGHYEPLAALLAEHAARLTGADATEGCVLDVGAGTGHYLARVLDRCPALTGLAIDISRFAARRAARAHARAGALIADGERTLPIRNHSVALALSVFAPRNVTELHRILNRRGALLIVTPTDQHLTQLIQPMGLLSVDARKEERLHTRLRATFKPGVREALELTLRLTRDDAFHIAAMGPSAFHASTEELRRRADVLPELLTVSASFTVASYHRVERNGSAPA